MTGLPFALVVALIIVWAVLLLLGTLGSAEEPAEDDEARS